jgi:hypothetical protein
MLNVTCISLKTSLVWNVFILLTGAGLSLISDIAKACVSFDLLYWFEVFAGLYLYITLSLIKMTGPTQMKDP